MRLRGATHELNRRAIDPVSHGPSLRISHWYEEFPDNHTSVDYQTYGSLPLCNRSAPRVEIDHRAHDARLRQSTCQ
jgi:hypothetical protein